MKRSLVLCFLFSLITLVIFSCQKELSQESNLNNASFSLHDDSTKACFPITVNGTYYNGVSAKRDTNFIKVVVNVKSTGNYSISSSLSNGFSFSDSGFFSKTGFDTLILKAKGTPILLTVTDFTLSADSLGLCGFSVDVLDSTGTGLGGVDTSGGSAIDTSYVDSNPATDSSWHFTDSTNGQQYTGIMGKEGNSFVDSSGTYILTLAGVTSDSSQTFGFQLYTTKPAITPGVYPISGNTSLGFVTILSQSIVFVSNEALISGTPSYSYIRIDSYDATTKHIQGVFHCWALNALAQSVLIKGSFNTYLP